MQLSHLPAASALFASPRQASAMPPRPTPNFFSAARRVTDWARLFVSPSNVLFIALLFFDWLILLSGWGRYPSVAHAPGEDAADAIPVHRSKRRDEPAAADWRQAEIIALP